LSLKIISINFSPIIFLKKQIQIKTKNTDSLLTSHDYNFFFTKEKEEEE